MRCWTSCMGEWVGGWVGTYREGIGPQRRLGGRNSKKSASPGEVGGWVGRWVDGGESVGEWVGGWRRWVGGWVGGWVVYLCTGALRPLSHPDAGHEEVLVGFGRRRKKGVFVGLCCMGKVNGWVGGWVGGSRRRSRWIVYRYSTTQPPTYLPPRVGVEEEKVSRNPHHKRRRG